MSKVMQVLEQMGSDAHCQSDDAIKGLLAAAELATDMTTAIISKDVISLERQLDIRPDIVCLVLPAEDDEDEDDDKDTTEETSNRVIGF